MTDFTANPPEDAPTDVDIERRAGTPESSVTTLDPGRVRASDDDGLLTVPDVGRLRPEDAAGWTVGLPSDLAARFEMVRVLTRAGGQADILLVRERASGSARVIKHYRTRRERYPQVLGFLQRRHSRHIVEVFETGADYEIIEYIAGENLVELRRSHPTGLDTATLRAIVTQVADALGDLHEHGIVHRDLKPNNLLLRSRTPIDVVLIDLGISRPADGLEFASTRSGTLRYSPPEASSGALSEATDWWALGMTVLELTTGRYPFDTLHDDEILFHLSTRPINVSTVRDHDVRRLCQGLLLREPADRWGGHQVALWLAGGSPSIAFDRRADEEPGGVGHAYLFNRRPYHHRDLLATAFAESWEYAVSRLFGDDGGHLTQLQDWLGQFDDDQAIDARTTIDEVSASDEPGNVRLLRLVRSIDPSQPPVYRHELITPQHLPDLARAALGSSDATADVVYDLWTYGLLWMLATAPRTAGSPGGTGLAELAQRWQEERGRWLLAAQRLDDEAAQAEISRLQEAAGRYLVAVWLRAATGAEEDYAIVREEVRRAAATLPVRVPWFTDLANRPDSVWVAWILIPFARTQANSILDQEQRERDHRQALLLGQALSTWSRRQNRPLALAWAVSGIAIMAALWVLLIGLADLTDWVDDRTVNNAWIAAVLSIGLALAIESILAADIGGRFHPDYSMPGAGLIALSRAARRVEGHGVAAFFIIIAMLAALWLAAATMPVAIPIGAAAGHLLWAVLRHVSWRAQQAHELAQIERARQEA